MRRKLGLLLALILQLPLWSGCTAVLWERSTFSGYYHVGNPPNLQVYYSERRGDLLVQYDESRDKEKKVRRRYYWLEPNVELTESGLKPKFARSVSIDALQPVPQTPILLDPIPPAFNGLYVLYRPNDIRFAVYSGTNQVNSYTLPDYDGDQKVALKILLTPAALAVDATVMGAFIELFSLAQSGGGE
jgi:hypothetical protein